MRSIETFATDALIYGLERSVAFTVVFLVVGASWLLLRKRLGSHAGSLLFLLPLVVLVIPVERWIPNPWSGGNPIERAALSWLPQAEQAPLINPTTEGFLDFGPREATAMATLQNKPEESGAQAPALPEWQVMLFLTWIIGLVAFVARLIFRQRSIPELLDSARLVGPDELPFDVDDASNEAKVTRPVLILESPEFDSPVLWIGSVPGKFVDAKSRRNTATIIIPEGLTRRLSPLELRWVLLHELAHLARRDHLIELFQRLMGAAFCFHPLVWATNRISRSYRELACDDSALARCAKTDRKQCARALFEVVAHASALAKAPAGKHHRTTHAMSSLFLSKNLTRRRIMRLIEIDRPLARGLRLSAILPILLVSGVGLAAAHFPASVFLEPQGEESMEIMDHNEVDPLEDTALESANKATDWLMANQDKDGGWSYRTPTPKEVSGWAEGLKGAAFDEPVVMDFEPYHNNVALTALAVQSLVARANATELSPKLKASIDAGVASLLSRQDAKYGAFTAEGAAHIVGQALATEAIAMACKDRMTPKVKTALTAAVTYLERARNPYAAWRYSVPGIGDNDARITGYVMLALVSAFDAEVHASPETLASGMDYMFYREDAETGRTHYQDGVEFAFRVVSHKDSHPAERAEVPTAMHLRLRNSAGFPTVPKGAKEASIQLLGSHAPLWDLEKGTIDFTYWWQGTAALAGTTAGNSNRMSWNKKLRTVLSSHQIASGDQAGTWPTVDAWSAPGMEVYTTATCALALYSSL